MLSRGVSKNLDYGGLFQDWEIAVAKKLINKFRESWESLKYECFDDLLQECLIHWYLKKCKYDPKREASMKTYMGRIMRNKLTDLVREKESDKRKIAHLATSLDEPLGENEEAPSLMDHIKKDEILGCSSDPYLTILMNIDLSRALETLTTKQKKLCHLLGREGFTVKEASKYLKTPRSTIYDELKRIRAIFMKEGLEDYL